MRHISILHAFAALAISSSDLLFWRRDTTDEQREAVFNTIYDTVADLYETAASLKPEWSEGWENRGALRLPPKFEQDEVLPPRTIRAAQEMRFARTLLQQNRWRSVKQPLFDVVDPGPWSALQRSLQTTPAGLLIIEDEHFGYVREDESQWIARAVEGFDNARNYLRTAERQDEPLARQVANSAYVAIYLSLQLSDRFIERQRFELSPED